MIHKDLKSPRPEGSWQVEIKKVLIGDIFTGDSKYLKIILSPLSLKIGEKSSE
jgi:hypothetical protein